ncbi:SdrD B-like domain-containing protein [Paenibacillus sp. strain BS8-2]
MHVTRSSRHQKKHDLLRGLSRMPALGGNGITLRQKSIALLMAMLLLIQTIQLGGLVQHTSAAPVPDSVIKKVLLLQGESFTESQLLGCFGSMDASCASLRAAVLNNGSTSPVYTDDFEASIGASGYPFTLAYEWEIDAAIANDGGTYTIALPAQLKLDSSMTGVSLGNAGTFDVDQATKTITMHFAAQTGPLQLSGGMQVNAWLEETTVIVDNEILVRIPVSATAQIDVTLPVSFGNPTPNISKTMVSRDRAINTTKVNWSIDFNKNLGTINQAIVTDTLPSQLALDETSLRVVPLSYDLHTGAFTEGIDLVKDTDYTLSYVPATNVFTVDLSLSGTLKNAYRIYYTSNVKSDATIPQYPGITLTNNVALFDDATSRATASANVTIQRGSTIEKTSTGYDSLNNHTATWSLQFNFGEFEYSDPVLTDLLPAGHQLVPGSMTVQQVAINPDGSAGTVLDTLDETTDYTLANTPSGNATDKDTFDLTLLGTINKAYKIAYATEAKAIAPVIDSGNKSNSLTTTVTTGTKNATVSYIHRVINKSGNITDYAAKEMTWTLELNKNEYRFEEEGTDKVRLVDTFNNRGLRLIPGSLAITRKGSPTPLVEGAAGDYTLTSNYSGSQETGFTILFNDSYLFNTEHTIVYKTNFDYEDYAVGSPWSSSNYRFSNTGQFFWGKITDSLGVALTGYGADSQSAGHTITPNNYTRDNGYKNGSYNTQTKATTWNVLFNYHNEQTVTGAVVTDTLQAGQSFDISDPAAIQIRRQNLAAGGGLSNGATLVRDTDYTVAYDTSGTNPVLSVTFAGTISGPQLITFKTSMVGDLVPATINNTASFSSANTLHRATLTASVTPSFGNEYITKSFIHPDAAFKRLVEWSIWINRSRSHLNDILIEDTPDQYQTLLQNEFKLYKATPTIPNPTADSHFTLTLVDPADYDLAFLPVSAATPGHLKFTLEIDNSDDHEAAYKLVYRSLLAAGTGNNITNQFSMSGWGSSVTSTTSQHTFPINKYSASGFSFPTGGSYNYLGEVTIEKQASDDNNIKLENAVFKIRPKYGADPNYLVTTDEHGIATFENLEYDVYEIIEVTAPTGYKPNATPIEVVVNQASQPTIVIKNVVNTGVIGNYVWLDLDRDGIQDAAETGINGITVRLYRDGEAVALESTTTANDGSGKPGHYLFDELAPGDYVVEFVVPNDYDLSPNVPGDPVNDSNPIGLISNKTDVITLNRANDFEDLTIDLGLIAKGAIGNYVWLDRDRDGLQDAEEAGINGIEVVLFKMIGGVRTEISRTTTANHPTASTSGYYYFDHLTGGSYYVQFLVPSSYDKTTVEVGSDEEIDSNFTDGTGLTNVITIGPGNWVDPTIDLGLQGKGSIGNYVWFDTNDDGIQDSGEPGIENLIVELYNGTTLVATTRTDVDGEYLFEHLVEGNYYVKFETPAIYDFAKSEQGGDAGIDSNEIYESGVSQGRTIDSIPIGPSGWTDLTIDLGFAGKGAIGNYVWHDRNRNGIQDEDPMHGINGVTVNLYRDTPTGTPFRTDTTSDEGGNPGYYNFTELPQGTYFVEFEFPVEYEKTAEETDNDSATGSNETNAANISNAIVISETATPFGWVNPSIDLGLIAQGSIGNYVWFDTNRNGIQDASEAGLNDITLRLYKNSSTGPVYAETVTANGPDGKAGYYLFDNLASGNYYVEIVFDSNHETTAAEQGSGVGADELDSNRINAFNKTVAITIGAAAPKGWHDHTIDFGIVRKGAIGDYVWHDADYDGRQDEVDFGMNGVVVELYNASRSLIATTVTANKDGKQGYYLFDHLVAGNYFVRFINPLYYIPTKQGADGVSDDLDSNPTLESFTASIAIGPAGPAVWRDLTIDQGYYYIAPVFPTPTPTPTTETETPSGTPAPTPTPVPGVSTPKPTTTPSPTSTSVTETIPEDTPIDIEVEVPKGGTTVPGTPPKHGTVVVTPDGKATYTPNPGYTGKDKFSIVVRDEDGNEEEFWFDIEVEEVPRGGIDGTPDVSNLPKTGQDSYMLLYLIGAAFIAFGIYMRVRNKRKTS